MIAEYGVRAEILADATIAALVGQRIYPHDDLPQDGPWPAITYQRISTVAAPLLAGDDEELPRVRLQLNCIAETQKAAKALAMEIRRLFRNGHAWSGVCLARVDGHSDLPRDPETNVSADRVDLVITLAAAEAA